MKNLKYSTLMGVFALSAMHLQPALALSPAQTSHSDDFTINRHEPLANLRFVEQRSSAKAKALGVPAATASKLSFKAYGRTFNLKLLDNSAIYGKLPEAQKRNIQQNLQIYKGSLAGIKGSWVRLNRSGTRLSGAIWDGKELFMIDSSDQVVKAIKNVKSAAGKPYPLVYKVSDTTSKATCGIDSKAKAKIGNTVPALFSELKTRAKALPATLKQLDVSITADTQFVNSKGSVAAAQSAAVAIMNTVDGIYSSQVGVNINLANSISVSGNLTATDAGTLLNQFLAAPKSNPGLAHLFTGRDLAGSTVGIAYIGVLCNKSYGVGLSQLGNTGANGALIVAHEMGHNFGANHDTSCAGAPSGYIMYPSINGSKTFSSCSLQSMAANVAKAACLGTGTDGGGSVPPPVVTNPPPPTTSSSADIWPHFPVTPISVLRNSQFKYQVNVKNSGSTTATGSTLRVTLPLAFVYRTMAVSVGASCRYELNSTRTKVVAVNCSFGNLAPSATKTLILHLTASSSATKTISTVAVSASNESSTNKINNTDSVGLNIR